LIGVLILAGVGAAMLARQDASDDLFAECRTTSIAGVGGDRRAVHAGVGNRRNRDRPDVITMPTLLYFGYTFCPDVCPLDTVRNAEAVDILEQQGIMVQPVMISVDPERDTPEVMDDFTANVHPRMLGLTGTPEQTDAAARPTGSTTASIATGDDPYYLVDHSAFAYLVLPEYGFVEFFNRDVTPGRNGGNDSLFRRGRGQGPEPPAFPHCARNVDILARTTYTRQIDHPLHCSISCG
jgi:protein SCO1/2